MVDGEVSVAHAQVLAHGTSDLPDHVAVEAEPVLVEAARRLDPPRLRRVLGHLHQVADPEGADRQAERRHQGRGLWLTPTWLHGGPTDLANLALLCRAHHRAVHEGGWRPTRHQPDGRFTATPPYRRHPTSRGHPTAA